MERVREGNLQAFDTLYQRYCLRVASFFRNNLVDISATDDVTQEVFIRIWDKREKYKSGTPDLAYLLGYSRFVLLEYRAKYQSRSVSEIKYAQDSVLESTQASPLSTAEMGEQRQILRILMATLPEKQRQALELRYLKDLSSQEASQLLACTASSVRHNSRLAVVKLRNSGCARVGAPGCARVRQGQTLS